MFLGIQYLFLVFCFRQCSCGQLDTGDFGLFIVCGICSWNGLDETSLEFIHLVICGVSLDMRLKCCLWHSSHSSHSSHHLHIISRRRATDSGPNGLTANSCEDEVRGKLLHVLCMSDTTLSYAYYTVLYSYNATP